MPDFCPEGRTFVSPASFELFMVVLVTLLSFVIISWFLLRLHSRCKQTSASTSNRWSYIDDDCVANAAHHFGMDKTEFKSVIYVISYFLFFGLYLIRAVLHVIPEFEHHLSHSSSANQSVSDDDENAKDNNDDDFTRVMQWCRFERTSMFGCAVIMNWILKRMLFERLFNIFQSAPAFGLSDKLRNVIILGLVDGMTAVFFISLSVSMPFDICIGQWKVIDSWLIHDDSDNNNNSNQTFRFYRNCVLKGHIGILIAVGFYLIYELICNVLGMLLFVRKFSELIQMNTNRAITNHNHNNNNNDNNNQESNQNENENKMEKNDDFSRSLLALMAKLTTLSLTAIVSTLLLSLLLSLSFLLNWPSEWTFQLNFLINGVCLILVFAWLNDTYELVCRHDYCCISHWVDQQVSDDQSALRVVSTVKVTHLTAMSNSEI